MFVLKLYVIQAKYSRQRMSVNSSSIETQPVGGDSSAGNEGFLHHVIVFLMKVIFFFSFPVFFSELSHVSQPLTLES